MEILEDKFYTVINPISGREEKWSGERIKKFKQIYRAEVEVQDLKVKGKTEPKPPIAETGIESPPEKPTKKRTPRKSPKKTTKK